MGEFQNKRIAALDNKERLNAILESMESTCTRVVLFEKTDKRYMFSILEEEQLMKQRAERYLFISSLVGNIPSGWYSITKLSDLKLKEEGEPFTTEDYEHIYDMFA